MQQDSFVKTHFFYFTQKRLIQIILRQPLFTEKYIIPIVRIKQSKLFYTFTVVNADCSEVDIPIYRNK